MPPVVWLVIGLLLGADIGLVGAALLKAAGPSEETSTEEGADAHR